MRTLFVSRLKKCLNLVPNFEGKTLKRSWNCLRHIWRACSHPPAPHCCREVAKLNSKIHCFVVISHARWVIYHSCRQCHSSNGALVRVASSGRSGNCRAAQNKTAERKKDAIFCPASQLTARLQYAITLGKYGSEDTCHTSFHWPRFSLILKTLVFFVKISSGWFFSTTV